MKKIIYLFFILFFAVACSVYHPVVQSENHNIPVDQTQSIENPEILSLISPYKQDLQKDMSMVLAVSDVEMFKNKPESNLTNFMADLLLEEAKKYCMQNNIDTPEVAYINYGGIRASLPKGEINVQKVFELMPFENKMVLIQISGEKLYKMAEIIASRGGDGVAGIKLGIHGKQVSSLLINGEKLKTEKLYWLTTNDYVAKGGDNMTMFLEPEQYISSNTTIRNIIIEHMKNMSKKEKHITAQKDGRIFYE